MAVNPNDAYYRAEVVPDSIDTLGDRLCGYYGVSALNFGDRGNLGHTEGYHRSRRYNQVHDPSNYSIQLALDKLGDGDWIRAFDFTPGEWGSAANRAEMIRITKRMRAAALAKDPRIRALREFAGTEDGLHVVTIDMQTGGNLRPFDSSHLDHGHGSIFTKYAADDHTGIFEVMTGTTSTTEDDMSTSTSWTQPLTQGTPGYAGQQRDTALAFTWQASDGANKGVQQLLAAADAEKARDAAESAAIVGLTTLVQQLAAGTGGDVDIAPVVSAVNAAADRVRDDVIAELRAQAAAAESRATVAAARADELEAELAAAYLHASIEPASDVDADHGVAGAVPGSGSE